MNNTRRLSIAALCVACLHLVFGAIVRISGSGMGCGDNWPKCYGYWIPPFSRPDLIVEVSHRYLASILTLTVLSLALVAWRNRRVTGGAGGPMRSAFGAVAAVFTAAILGGVTVKMGNAPWATVAHWLVAMTLLAMVAMTAIRAGALGGASSLVQRGTDRARRSAFAAAVMAIFAVALGGLTAKYPGAAVGCTTVPLCGPNVSVEPAGIHIQMTHRTIAVILVLHLIGMVMMLRKRHDSEAPVVVRAAHVALGMVLLQLVVASSMILFHLPPVLRSLHEATGVGIWLSCFALAYLARRAARVSPPDPAVIIEPYQPPPVRRSEPTEEVFVKVETPTFEAAPVVSEIVAPVEDSAVAVEEEREDEEREAVLEELDWEPKRSAVEAEELDEFSIAAMEALEVEARAVEEEAVVAEERDLERAECPSERSEESIVLVEGAILTAGTVDPSVAALPQDDTSAALPQDELVAAPIELVAGDSSVVAPPVEAPKLSSLPAPTMAVLVARGADML
jgi:heme A synthase